MKFNKYTGKFCPDDSDFENMPASIAVIFFGVVVIAFILAIVL